jgi:diadenylate cyclase
MVNEILDKVIIAVIVYLSLIAIKKTRSYYILYGIVALFLIYLASIVFELKLMSALLKSLKNMWIVIIIVLYQPEIRDFLIGLKTKKMYSLKFKSVRKSFNSILIDAISAMSIRRIGALIIIEGKRRLDDFNETGEILDSLLSLRLILSIFNTKSVLHDGAVVVRNDRLIAAKVVLPLSRNADYKKSFGTRHLAAIGITEVSDSLAIVVSEQTGRVSVSYHGEITTDVSFEELMQILNETSR